MLDKSNMFPKNPPTLESNFRAAMADLHEITYQSFLAVANTKIEGKNENWLLPDAVEVFKK